MATYTTPQFNVVMDRWVPPATPATGAPTFTGGQYQLYVYSRKINYIFEPSVGRDVPSIIARYSDTTPNPPGVGDIFRITLTHGPVYYLVRFLSVFHAGFPNKYRGAICVQCSTTGAIIVP